MYKTKMAENNIVSLQWIPIVVVLVTLSIVVWVYTQQLVPLTHEHFSDASSSTTIPTDNELKKNFERYALKRQSTAIYDKYYVALYVKLFDEYKQKLVIYEINDLIRHTRLREYGSRAIIADLGCGTGTHLRHIANRKIKAKLIGIEVSRNMLQKASESLRTYTPTVRLLETSFDNPASLGNAQCTHITCYYFSIYYSSDYKQLLQNVFDWLADGGYFCVHLVDVNKFDPVLDAANPFIGISLQAYMPKRKKESVVILDDCLYKSNFTYHPRKGIAYFKEHIIFEKERKYREHVHKLIMPSHNRIIEDARRIGFKLRNVSPLYNLGYEYQYLCYLQKSVRKK
jgi:SAM-dependent methyltransferase